MKNQSVLFSIAAAILLFGTTPKMHAGTATNVLKKTTGAILAAVSVATAVELGFDFGKIDIDCNFFDPIHEVIGCGAWIFAIPVIPSIVLNSDTELIKSENYSIAARLTLLAATGYGSYKLLKSSVDEQEDNEEEGYEYVY